MIPKFRPPKFYETHAAAVLNRDLQKNKETSVLVYDSFAALTVISCMSELAVEDGLHTNPGNGDSADYRFTAP
ncbi:hypothetical protein [Amycolatopsis sp. lyj-112]|uniref:hypothetical protein n=1 Tax=Amycolatopsis sp. lyj-112 TaxID=2789288 RepID=UPI00397BDDB0